MKKKLMVLALTLLVALSIGLVACVEPGTGKTHGNNGKFDDLKTTESVYGFSAASAGMLISSMGNGANTAATAAEGDVTNALDTAQLDNYMALVESLLSDGKIENSAIGGELGYEYGMSVKYTDLRGKEVSYRMFYNKTFLDGKTDGDEKKENYSISGVLLIDGNTYSVEGMYKTETENGEFESDLYFKAYVNAEKTSYIEVEREMENESGEDAEIEQKYVYSVYESGKLIERSSFSFETEQNETELKMSTLKDGQKQVIYFEKEVEDGKDVIKIHIGDGKNGKGYIVHIIKDETGATRYEYTPTKYND